MNLPNSSNVTKPLGIKFRKKPSEIEALQFLGTLNSIGRLLSFIGPTAATTHVPGIGYIICIKNLVGEIRIYPGDWVIKNGNDFSGCKPDVFDRTYEACT
jgi:hypothetical protein